MMPEKLGSLFFYAVASKVDGRQATYSREDLLTLFADNGLPTQHIPKGTSKSDALRKACTSAQRMWGTRKDVLGRKVKTRITEVHNDAQYLQRDVVQEIVSGAFDKRNHLTENKIEQSAFKIVLRKDIGEVRMHTKKPIDELISDGDWALDYDDMIGDIFDLYNQYDDHIDDAQMRLVVKDTIDGMGGRPFRAGRGVYFIPEKNTVKAQALLKALHDIKGCDGEMVTLYDEAGMKERMTRYFAMDMVRDLKSFLEEIQSDSMRSDKLGRLNKELDYYKNSTMQYAAMLNSARIPVMVKQAEIMLGFLNDKAKIRAEQKEALKARRKAAKGDTPRGRVALV